MKNTEAPPVTAAIPASTYRLQFNRLLTFEKARRVVPYLDELGITCVYCSPYFRSMPGSLHGYDITRYDELNPEVGTAGEYGLFTGELARRGMQQILDIVPHHMCILGENPWWQSVLENGQSSPFASFFDIDWSPPLEILKGKVLLPILADQYGKALESGEITLDFRDGSFFIIYGDNRLPVEPRSYELVLRQRLEELEKEIPESAEFQELMSIITALGHLPEAAETDPEKRRERNREKEVIKRRLAALHESSEDIRRFLEENIRVFNGTKADRRSFDLLDGLISGQPYRLSFWMVATDEINYRRFFDINELAAVRVEQPEVFNESHRLVLELIRQGKVNGLRVDHLDGLYNPAEYLRTLQEKAFLARIPEDTTEAERQALAQTVEKELMKTPPAIPFYIVGEKILQKGERIPEDWPIFGTTGYSFMNSLNGLFVREDNAKLMDDIYSRFTGQKVNFAGLQYQAKKLILESSMSGEVNILGHRLHMLAQKSRLTRDFTFMSLTKALSEVIACFPVYRTYISSSGVTDRDRRYIEQAVSKARRLNPSVSSQIFNFIRQVLALEYAEELSPDEKAGWFDFAMRFQQQTGPVMAKGIEDTAFYVYNRLLSLNEVGGAPDRFGTPIETFHGQNIERNKYWPFSLTATSTHDSKRSEDVRARINVLTEMPRAWRDATGRWKRANRRKRPIVEGKPVPDSNDEYHLYQIMIGVWPPGPPDKEELAGLRQRIGDYMLKAIREAKVNSSWISPNKEYEDALKTFIELILNKDEGQGNSFLSEFDAFARTVAWYGMLNGLSQVLLKAASPGVPDFYQGTEFWTLSLVDPDNRREVDYEARARALKGLKAMEGSIGKVSLCRELLGSMQDSRVKLYAT
nr:malto-oligosyltrehalose synthase [Nitrospiraceae bacterium]